MVDGFVVIPDRLNVLLFHSADLLDYSPVYCPTLGQIPRAHCSVSMYTEEKLSGDSRPNDRGESGTGEELEE